MVDRIWGNKELNVYARPYIGQYIADHVTSSIALLYRLSNANRKVERTGTHVEEPFLYRLYDVYDVYGYSTFPVSAPPESVVNMAFDMSTKLVPIVISKTELIQSNTPDAFASLLAARTEVAKLTMAERLASALWRESGTSPVGPGIIGVNITVDDGTVSPTYGNQSRTTYPGLAARVDTSGAMTLATLQTMWSSLTRGGNHPTSVWSRADQYNKYVALLQTNQRFIQGPEVDRRMADAGFTNVAFNTAPWILDDYVPDSTSGPTSSKIFFLNENWWTLYVNKLDNFAASEFAAPIGQKAWVADISVTLQLVCRQPRLQGVFSNMTS